MVSTKGKVTENSEVDRQRVREKADITIGMIMMTIPVSRLLTRAKPRAHEAVSLLKVRAREEVLPQGLAARAKVKVKAKAKAIGADHHQKAEARVALRSHVPSSRKAFDLTVTNAGIVMMENLPRATPHLPQPPK